VKSSKTLVKVSLNLEDLLALIEVISPLPSKIL
jgi:hypothetical protein